LTETPPPIPTVPEIDTTPLAFTGERFHPDRSGEMWYEHWHRYAAVVPLVRERRVLDIACGEGYGSAHLAKAAVSVIGVDISPEAVAHARSHYQAVNLSFSEGSCTAIPLADASVDVVVSFETLEHIEAHDAFLAEIKRVLVPGGLCIISTPNKAAYTDARDYHNEYHVKELYLSEFESLLGKYWAHHTLYGQRNGFHSQIAPLATTTSDNAEGSLTIGSISAQAGEIPAPLYVIALCSDDAAQIVTNTLPLSAYTAREDRQIDIFMQIWRHSQHLETRVADLTVQNKLHEETLSMLGNELIALRAAQTAKSEAKPVATDDSAIARFIKKLSQ
jgi:2-polyprenyl-3-methyl-5-hydroxy-6-metoxy-1,4-benzoquinol methylase